MPNIRLRPFAEDGIPLFLDWAKQPHVANTWFLPGYHPPEEIRAKLCEKPYDYPYVILLDGVPIAYAWTEIVNCQRKRCEETEDWVVSLEAQCG